MDSLMRVCCCIDRLHAVILAVSCMPSTHMQPPSVSRCTLWGAIHRRRSRRRVRTGSIVCTVTVIDRSGSDVAKLDVRGRAIPFDSAHCLPMIANQFAVDIHLPHL